MPLGYSCESHSSGYREGSWRAQTRHVSVGGWIFPVTLPAGGRIGSQNELPHFGSAPTQISLAPVFGGWTFLGPGLISSLSKWLSSLLQHYNSKESILGFSAFFIAQLSHLNMTIRKTIALTIWTFVGKVMSLLFNTLSRLIIAFLPRSKL